MSVDLRASPLRLPPREVRQRSPRSARRRHRLPSDRQPVLRTIASGVGLIALALGVFLSFGVLII